MLPIDWKVAVRYASLVNIAYSVAPSAEYDAVAIAKIGAAGYQYLHTVYGDDLATEINPHQGNVVSYGFLAVSPAGELVAVVRGTETVWEWIHDASFLLMPCCVSHGQGLTEDGFSGVYRSLRIDHPHDSSSARTAIQAVLNGGHASMVTVTGHSLGAALATLLALDVALNTNARNPTCYTYASPRVGDHFFAASYGASVPMTFRIANRHDLVPQLPSVVPLPYEHVNTAYELVPPPGKVLDSLPCMHYLSTHLWLMDQQGGGGSLSLDPACKTGP